MHTVAQDVRRPVACVVAVLALGAHHSAAVSTTGTLLGWGANASGQVGLGAPSTSVLSPTAVSGLAGVTALALGGTHTVALAMDGGVWTWGSDVYAQSVVCLLNAIQRPRGLAVLVYVPTTSSPLVWFVLWISGAIFDNWL